MSLAPTIFAAGGFLAARLGASAVNQRLMLYQASDANGKPALDSNGQPIYTAFNAYVALSEDHNHELLLTEHPVEQGAAVSDHAYKLPVRLAIRIAWTASSVPGSGQIKLFGVNLPTLAGFTGINAGAGQDYIKSIFAQIVQLQVKRSLIDIYTGKYAYRNMMIVSFAEQTNNQTENVLVANLILKEVILFQTRSVVAPINPATMAEPQKGTPTVDQGAKSPTPPTNYNPAPTANPKGVPAEVIST